MWLAGRPTLLNIILISCADLIEIRSKYFNVNSLKSRFQDVSLKSIFVFLKEISLFWRL